MIELMVVLAIIGILSTVVLALLTRPRGEGSDATAKADFHTIIQQSALYYDNNLQRYGTVTTALGTNAACSAPGSLFLDTAIAAAIANADKNALGGAGHILCSVGKNGVAGATPGTKVQDWAVYVPLNYPVGGPLGWCADATGVSKADNAPATSGTFYDCP